MKPRKPLTLRQYYKIGLAIKFEITPCKTGLIFYQNTQVPKFHTPNLAIDAFTFRLHRKGLKLIGFIKNPYHMELYYQPQKIVAA